MSAAVSEGEPMSDINVTPLVDVMLVLLIIFIITIRVIIQQVQLDLPKATNLPTQTKPENITIAVDKQGDIYWNTKKLSGQDELKTMLRGIVRALIRSRKCTFAATRMCAISSWVRCSWHAADRHPQSGVHHHARSFRPRT
jgi:biopolymer transport protein ExbD